MAKPKPESKPAPKLEQKLEAKPTHESEPTPMPKKKPPYVRKFCEGFFMWLLGIVISAVPVFLKHLSIYFGDASISEYNFFEKTLGDFDFSFISVSVLFILILEELLLRDKVPGWHKKFRACAMICLLATCSIYCTAFFLRGQLAHKLPITQFGYNIFTLALTILFGVESHIAITLREGGLAC